MECVNCQTNKLPDAFPRAQLEQAGAAVKRRCLKCLKTIVKELTCCGCEEVKDVQDFSAAMVTMPSGAAVCLACQVQIGKSPDMRDRKGWFACQSCKQFFPSAGGRGASQKRLCMNCSSRTAKSTGTQTCRNKACKRKFQEMQAAGQARKRYCPDCRR